jgi:hypothetical protein
MCDLSGVIYRIAGRMSQSMIMIQTEVYEYLERVRASFGLDEEVII